MTALSISLSRLLTVPRSADLLVSIDGDRAVDWSTFTGHVARLATLLAGHGRGRWLLFTENTFGRDAPEGGVSPASEPRRATMSKR